MAKHLLWNLTQPLGGGMRYACLHQPRADCCVTFDSS